MSDPAYRYAVQQYNLLTADMLDALSNEDLLAGQPVIRYFVQRLQQRFASDYENPCCEALRIADEMSNSPSNIAKAAR